jgi:hypothetical protein
MRNKEVYRTLNKNRTEQEQLQCELCNKLIEQESLIEISNNKDSTILCSRCAVKFNNVSSLYDE